MDRDMRPRGRVTQEQGSPAPGPQAGTGPWPVRNPPEQQVSGGRVHEVASSAFTAAPHCSYCCQRPNCSCSVNSVNVTRLKYPNTIPTRSMGKLTCMKLAPGIKKVGDDCLSLKKQTLKRHWLISTQAHQLSWLNSKKHHLVTHFPFGSAREVAAIMHTLPRVWPPASI